MPASRKRSSRMRGLRNERRHHAVADRRFAPVTRMPIRRILGAYLNEVKCESLRMPRKSGSRFPFWCCRFRCICSSA